MKSGMRRLSWKVVKGTALSTYRNQGEHNTSLLAAGVAFYSLFAIFPAIGAATWIFGLLANPATIHEQLYSFRDVLPAGAWKLIDRQLTALTSGGTSLSVTGIFSLLVAFYSARLAASSMMAALNVVYGLRETRGYFKRNAIALLFTVVAIVILLTSVGVLVVLPIVFRFVGLGSLVTEFVRYARWPGLAILMALALAMTYLCGPDKDNARWKWLTWGSGLATILWLIACFGFSWYVSAFNSYDKVYGSIGAVAVLLFWLWITTFIGLIGAELDDAIERQTGSPPAPPGSPKAA